LFVCLFVFFFFFFPIQNSLINSSAKFQTHLKNLVLLTNRKLDQEAFEEKCISLYGANSYTLFGSSILLDAIVDLVKVLVADTPSSELSRKMIAEYFSWSVWFRCC
jgi:hypothetical protein